MGPGLRICFPPCQLLPDFLKTNGHADAPFGQNELEATIEVPEIPTVLPNRSLE